ncbi:ubiquitin domain protein [Aspergillus ellipticus CBS 707.79]|uniref:Ubiquitin domain protein n=1 Tax=Aspergillus ellipticus CBS 707.79 TaxID=1448320 RepID=A0A319E6V5_9EURO|nr:ubiquitin domain protein [Aspergillus ellipticus CBS 707.79]
MGCCLSLSRDNDRPSYAAQVVTEERRPEESHPRAVATSNALSSANTSATARAARTRTDHFPLNQHYNAPIRRHVWYSKRRLWTRAQLDQERTEFFETRVTGRSEVWAALSTAITLVRAGDIATAQSIVDAAGVTVPTGDLCQGCYDEQGVLYRLPQCVVSDPENIVRPDGEQEDFDTDDGKLSSDEASGDELIADDAERRRDEKGKTSERDLIRVRARLSDRDGPDVILTVGKSVNVGLIARKVQQEAVIPRSHRVKFAYLGRILKEHVPLVDQGWNPAHVINALVVPRQSES